jgi:dienelactone hydrolase
VTAIATIRRLAFVVPLGLALAFTGGTPDVSAAAPSAKKLVESYLKAKKDKDREKAWAAIVAAPAIEAGAVPALAAVAVKLLRKRGQRIKSGRNEWFDAEKDGWQGLYLTSGKGKKGLALGLHGGGAGSGDAGQASSAFGGPISSLGFRGVFPEVLQKTEYGWVDPPETERWIIEELLPAAIRTWDVDPDRIYVTGHSMGGFGTWTYGAVHADRFAGGAAFAGAPTVYWVPGGKDKEAEAVVDGILPNLYNLPLFVYQSLDDRNVPAAANVHACARLKELHASDPEGWEFVYEEVDGRGHAFPEKGPKPGLEWMASHARNPRPTTIRWQPCRDWKKRFYWLRWERPWIGCELVATVDAETNTIEIVIEKPRTATPQKTESERESFVSTLEISLDGDIVDMSREVVIRVDGAVRYRGTPSLSLPTLVRTAEEREDPRYVFAAQVGLDPPPPTTDGGE